MIKVRRETERRHVQRGEHEVWHTFYPEAARPNQGADHFAVLATFNEIRLPPGGVWTPHPPEAAEILTYVYRGALAQEDSTGTCGVLHAGEFQRMTVGRRALHKETNASRGHWAHVFRLVLHPVQTGSDGAHEQRRFAAAQRHNVLCAVASPDGRKGSLPILQDALLYSSVLDPGHHLIHELLPNRSVWLHLICGEATLHDVVLNQGDGAGVTGEPAVSFTAREHTEILLIDLGSALRPPLADGPAVTDGVS
ncbi:MAG: pirin family protein [Deltaproteobacteria bacterium]|nr:pirin family protein [Deltaproteobacteria bacterium]